MKITQKKQQTDEEYFVGHYQLIHFRHSRLQLFVVVPNFVFFVYAELFHFSFHVVVAFSCLLRRTLFSGRSGLLYVVDGTQTRI